MARSANLCKVVCALCLLSCAGPVARADVEKEIKAMADQVAALRARGEFQKALQAAQRMVAFAEKNQSRNLGIWMSNLAMVESDLGDYDAAERHARQSLELVRRSRGPDTGLASASLTVLGDIHYRQFRFPEAVADFKEALTLAAKQYGPESAAVVENLRNLASVYDDMGRHAEAEPLFRRAMALDVQLFGTQSEEFATSCHNLGDSYRRQNRFDEAEQQVKAAIQVFEKLHGPDHVTIARSSTVLGLIYQGTGRLREAHEALLRAGVIYAKTLGPGHERVAFVGAAVARTLICDGQFREAEPILKESLDCFEQKYGTEHRHVAVVLGNLGQVYGETGRFDEALQAFDRALAIDKRWSAAPIEFYWTYLDRGETRMLAGRNDAADDFRRAIEAIEAHRVNLSGTDEARARSFSRYANGYWRLAQCEIRKPDLGAALSALERGRARSLIDQMTAARVDLLAGVPPEQAERLRQAQSEAEAKVAVLERRLQLLGSRKDAGGETQREQAKRVQEELETARSGVVRIYAEVRNLSPAYRQVVGRDFQPVALGTLDSWLRKRKTLLLYYTLTDRGGYAMSIGRGEGGPAVTELKLSADEATALGGQSDKVTPAALRKIIEDEKQGVLRLLSDIQRGTEATKELAALWEVLIPAADRESLVKGKYDCLVIVPDGPLALLPFETLVVEPKGPVKYLLDVGPPIVYAPSATILVNLAEQNQPRPPMSERAPVLTLGDPAYDPPDANNAASAGPERAWNSARFSRLGGHMRRLPYSGTESTFIKEVFAANGAAADQLLQATATEDHLRGAIAGRRIIHLACHGLADMSYGNLFGCLALTPGPPGVVNPNDDGFLTLAEIYQLDLRGSELAILSACQTNYGPRQRGEALWALTRGFLVAGSRRVISTNWLVDDAAGASLMSYACGGIAQAEKGGGKANYATALQAAKRWIRANPDHPEWKSPYYWAPFVLVGPN